MNTGHGEQKKVYGDNPSRRPSCIPRRIIICTLIILIGVAGYRYMVKNKPTAKRRPPEKSAQVVRVLPLHLESYRIRIEAMGSVIPSREIELKVPVAGEIISTHKDFTEGGLLETGVQILQIDPKDYQLALQQKQRALSNAEYELSLEQGRQNVAQKEWDLLYGDKESTEVESSLALRKPHLEKVQADIKASRAELEQVKVNLARTTVKAPFNVLVRNKYVDKGSFVSSQEKLADLVGTDEYWVQVSLPVERLQWVTIPEKDNDPGSGAEVYYRQEIKRDGKVLRLMADLSREGRMARLLVSVKDPLGLHTEGEKKAPLLIGEFVRVSIEGQQLENVYRIPRTALHNNSVIWLVKDDNTLKVLPVLPLWRDEEYVLVKDGLQPGDRLVVSSLSAPVDGMNVRTDDRKEKPARPSNQE